MKVFTLILTICCVISTNLFSQVTNFNLDDYQTFYQNNQNLTYSSLLNMHSAGVFNESSTNLWDGSFYKDSIVQKYSLTEYEQSLIRTKGFMVSQRLSGTNFITQMADIYHKDLPVFISTDAILHAFHFSYDKILKDVELGSLISENQSLLSKFKAQFPSLEIRYAGNTEMLERLKDLDFYLSVPAKLLDNSWSPYYSSNEALVNEFIGYINNETPMEIPFLSSIPRKIDFSQFKVRGHYDDMDHPELGKYFKAMIWFGRMELYLIAPDGVLEVPTFADVKRQGIVANLFAEFLDDYQTYLNYFTIENILQFFVGYQDNVNIQNLLSLQEEIDFENSAYLQDSSNFVNYQNLLAQKSYAGQMILSQMLTSSNLTGDSIKPASAFMLFGQRFVIDSYVTGNVVYDKIRFNGMEVRRMLPNPLDVLFAIGNDAALQLLQNEIQTYNYSQNLASLRYMVDSYGEEFWKLSMYNSWLNAIRELNPPSNRENLPPFMQTAAWWQEKMNTQLGSWAELRHDNLLYAKQSYSGMPICSFPYSYVEPYPSLYSNLSNVALFGAIGFSSLSFQNNDIKTKVVDFLVGFKKSCDTLAVIAEKELQNVELNDIEKDFLKRMMRQVSTGCSTGYDGWFPKMFYLETGDVSMFEPNYIVADYHTSPADEAGNLVGWVKHAGTGKVDMLVTSVTMADNQTVAFVGPVYSFYDYCTSNFLRLTDTEWKEQYLNMALRPDWVNSYLANSTGETMGQGNNLFTDVEEDNSNTQPETYLTVQNYPNPFNASTLINFSIPANQIGKNTTIKIYNINGELIKEILNENLTPGNYVVSWDGTNSRGILTSSGVYLCELKCGNLVKTNKMIMVK